MKKKITLVFALLIFSVAVKAQTPKQAIMKVLETQRQAWNRGDLETFMQAYWKSDSLVFVGSSGPTYGWQNTLDNYKKSYSGKAGMGELTFKILKVELLNKQNAFVLGGWHLKREKDEPAGYFTLWFKQIAGRWVIVCDHSS